MPQIDPVSAEELAEAVKQCQRQNRQMAICEELIAKYAPDLEDKEYPDGTYNYGYQMAEAVPRLAAQRDALAAHCMDLRCALEDLITEGDRFGAEDFCPCEFENAKRIAATTPAQSFEAYNRKVGAEALREVANGIARAYLQAMTDEPAHRKAVGAKMATESILKFIETVADSLEAGDDAELNLPYLRETNGKPEPPESNE